MRKVKELYKMGRRRDGCTDVTEYNYGPEVLESDVKVRRNRGQTGGSTGRVVGKDGLI